jgi:hypothetical protein
MRILDPGSGRIRKVRFSVVITDEQWSRIALLSGLPPEASSEMDEGIGLYRQLRSDAQAEYGGVRKKLQLATEREEESLRTLADIISSPDVLAAIATGRDGHLKMPGSGVAAIRRWLKNSLREKKALVNWYGLAIERIHSGKPGRRGGRDSLFILVQNLNILLHTYKNTSISRSDKKGSTLYYVREVCRIANPALKNSTIDGAVSAADGPPSTPVPRGTAAMW